MKYYFEKCQSISMPSYSFFLDKLEKVQKLSEISDLSKISKFTKFCPDCKINKLYRLSNIIWADNMKHLIEVHQKYPSDYFIQIILSVYIVNNIIVNPPIVLRKEQIKNFKFIKVTRNNFLIIDALEKQGSHPIYYLSSNKYIYSEHSGVLSIKNDKIDNIIVSAETDRIDKNDSNIYLPRNTLAMKDAIFFFHTHPNKEDNKGRIKERIVYDFPSANDIFNFIKYNIDSKAQASIVVATEGCYVIRCVSYQKQIDPTFKVYKTISNFIFLLEKEAMKKICPWTFDYSNPDLFHKNISQNLYFIQKLNKFLKKINIFIEYYPRIKINNIWILNDIYLALIS